MLLAGKNAIVYGAAGQVGTALSTAFARAGARVHLAGRTARTLEDLAERLRGDGGQAEPSVVDALDETAVDAHTDAVAATWGSVDICVSVIDIADAQGTPLAEMSLEDFERPVRIATRSTFLTARAAARHMVRRRSGVILTFGGDGGGEPMRDYSIGGLQVALNAVDFLRRQLAAELGSYGIRVLGLHTGGVVEGLPDDFGARQEVTDMIVGKTMLGRAATFADVGNVAVFAASDLAASMTATSLNITCGAVAD
ncbi:SDR family NAD(P)-dependent oxidoreductase [Actinophytocola oryzae]|uniref:NAD(P)-dependent dehydrogenase (Short-subunit alcohol dehydrogenase family) n=1 Tax=Actinophytocola oryzae TaxID=502181 RepID=A0A4R7VF18_9PSEU|nr:SDR family oxidoreductase [Actinophytocola oryzae]TDV47820.1 NAD(P)-dependent dehydrogenase (short-subunit alcohol dehydrogenase family) [Actinophytocola oryzae]